jgi:hypothetical protein
VVGLVVGERNDCVVEVVGAVDEGFDYAMVVEVVDGDLIERSFMPMLLLTKNIKSVLHLCEPCSLLVDVLSMSFDMLDCSRPS